MELNAEEGGALTGLYRTAVGNVPESTSYPISGRYSSLPGGEALLGWTVSWNQQAPSLQSISSWTGRVSQNEGATTISTTWILVKDDAKWCSTLTNQDLFTKH